MPINTWKKTLADEIWDDPKMTVNLGITLEAKAKRLFPGDVPPGKHIFSMRNAKMQDGWYEQNGDVYYLGDEDDEPENLVGYG